MKIRKLLSIATLASIIQPIFASGWFYGHPAPTVSAEVAHKNWQGCVTDAAALLDDHVSSAMDVATAIEPLCRAKEDIMIDAIDMQFLDKNPSIAANMSLTAMEHMRQDAYERFRKTIGTLVLMHRAETK